MAKELPYFKFEPSEWDNGNIQLCSLEAQGTFVNLCSIYWSRLGDLPYKLALVKICRGKEALLTSLIDNGVIKSDGQSIRIDFLDNQLEEFKIISNKRAEAGRKGGENRILSPEIARIRGNQIYVLHCYNDDEEFIKVGITSESISRRYSGKMPYSYDVIFQFLTDDNLDLESLCNEKLYSRFSYLPKIEFTGYLECFSMHVMSELNEIIKHRTGNVIAMPKRRNAIREEKRREDEIREHSIGATKVATKTIEERKGEFWDSLKPFWEKFGEKTVWDFYDYWIEKSPAGKKMRFEMQKVFDPARRLATWKKNETKKQYVRTSTKGETRSTDAIIPTGKSFGIEKGFSRNNT